MTCLLRYLLEEDMKKCPMCSDFTRRAHIKPLLLDHELTSTLHSQTPNPSTTTTGPKNTRMAFSLLLCGKTSLCPTVPRPLNTSASDGDSLQQKTTHTSPAHPLPIPLISSGDAPFSRLNCATPTQLQQIWSNRLAQLERYRTMCVQSANTELGTDVCVGVGDVEYLPFFPEAEEMLRSKLTASLHIPPHTTTDTSTEDASICVPSFNGSLLVSGALSEENVWLYQDQRGSAAFLHPLCVRCLQQQALKEAERLVTACTATTATTSSSFPSTGGDGSGDGAECSEEEKRSLSSANTSSTSTHTTSAANMASESSLTQSTTQPSSKNLMRRTDQGSPSGMCLSPVITASVLDTESLVVTEENRRKYPFVLHRPLECPFSLVEVDLRRVVDEDVYQM